MSRNNIESSKALAGQNSDTQCDTIKDVLARIGCNEFIEGQELMAVPVRYVSFCIGDNAGLFVHCSGEAIMSFSPEEHWRQQIYLVVDSQAHDIWMSKRQRGEVHPTTHGPCPSKKLRLVQSA